MVQGPDSSESLPRNAERALLVVLAFLIPLVLWPGNTTYDAAKFTLLALAASLWFVWRGWKLWRGEPVTPIPAAHIWSWATLLLVLVPGLWAGGNPLLVVRTFAILTLFGWVAGLTTRLPSRPVTILAALNVSAFLAALYGLFQMAHILPGAPAVSGFPAGISTLGNQNFLAGFLALSLGPSWILWRRLDHTPWRSLVLVTWATSAVVLMLSRATGPPLAVSMTLLTLAPAWIALRLRKSRWIPSILLAATLMVFCGAAGLLAVGGSRLDPERQSTAVERLMAANSAGERWTNWRVAWEMFREKPLAGVGAGNFLIRYPETRASLGRVEAGRHLPWASPLASKVHNDLLQWMAETGWLGLVWLAVHLCWFGGAWRRRFLAADRDERADMLILTGTLLIAVYHSLVSFPFRLPASGIVIALGLGLLSRGTAPQHETFRRQRRLAGLLTMALSSLILVAALLQFQGDQLVRCGRQAFLQARMEKAVECLESGVARMIWPGHGPLYLGLARSALGQTEASEDFRLSLRSRPTFEAYLALAQAEIDAGNLEVAGRYLERVRLCRPPLATWRQTQVLNGILAWKEGDTREAGRIFRDLLAEDPDQHRALLGLGYLEALAGHPDEARRYYTQALVVIDEAREAFRKNPGDQSPAYLYQLEQNRQVARQALEALP